MRTNDNPPSTEEPPPAVRPTEGPDGDAPASPGRSLIMLGNPREATDGPPAPRPFAPFLAHLIAAAQQLPQLRQRRRAEPQDGAASYAPPARATPGRSLSRSI
jgi:hypothetical protein